MPNGYVLGEKTSNGSSSLGALSKSSGVVSAVAYVPENLLSIIERIFSLECSGLNKPMFPFGNRIRLDFTSGATSEATSGATSEATSGATSVCVCVSKIFVRSNVLLFWFCGGAPTGL